MDIYNNGYSLGCQLKSIQNGVISFDNVNQINIEIFAKPKDDHRWNMPDITIKIGIVVCHCVNIDQIKLVNTNCLACATQRKKKKLNGIKEVLVNK